MGEVKHILLVKFKEGITETQIEQIIKDFANLVNLIEPMKSFQWGTNVSAENLDQGFTHVFETSFESTEGIAEYVVHPVHVEFGKKLVSLLEKLIVVDYKPMIVPL